MSQRRGRTNRKSSSQNILQGEEEGVADPTYNMFTVESESSKTEPIKVTVQVNGADLENGGGHWSS